MVSARAVSRSSFALAAISWVAAAALGRSPGGPWSEVVALGGAAADAFGSSVSLSGPLAVAGAPLSDVAGVDAGAAWVIDASTGQVLRQLLATNPEPDARYGEAVAISGGLAAVGAPRKDAVGIDSGAVYLHDAATGQTLFELHAPDGAPGDAFGESVALSGPWVLVGAPRNDRLGHDAGTAYVFDAATGQLVHQLFAADGGPGAFFGKSVSISGQHALIGAPSAEFQAQATGAAYVFDLVSGQQLAELTASDAAHQDLFGWSVSISGDIAAVGAPFDDDLGEFSGSVYVFDVTTGQELHKLLASDGTSIGVFGRAVSISNGLLLVGAPGSTNPNHVSGGVYLFDAMAGLELFAPLDSGSAEFEAFGGSVAISGVSALVGAPFASPSGDASGAVYLGADCNAGGLWDVLDLVTGTSLDCNGNAVPDECDISTGASPDCNGNGIPDGCEVVSGTSSDCDGNGVPDECDADANGNGVVDACECLMTPYCSPAANSDGTSAHVSGRGSTALWDGDFGLRVAGAKRLQFGLFFYSNSTASQPYGDGVLCVGSPRYRLAPVVVTDGLGRAEIEVDFDSPPAGSGPGQFTPFSTWYFQFWYRDPLGGPAGFNFSDGLEVTFCP